MEEPPKALERNLYNGRIFATPLEEQSFLDMLQGNTTLDGFTWNMEFNSRLNELRAQKEAKAKIKPTQDEIDRFVELTKLVELPGFSPEMQAELKKLYSLMP